MIKNENVSFLKLHLKNGSKKEVKRAERPKREVQRYLWKLSASKSWKGHDICYIPVKIHKDFAE